MIKMSPKAGICKCCGTVIPNPPVVMFGGIGNSVFNYAADLVECKNCGSCFFVGLDEDQVAQFYRTNESGYVGHPQFHSHDRVNLEKYEKYKKFIDILPYERSVSLCDLGCGGGGFLVNIAQDDRFSRLAGFDYDVTIFSDKFAGERVDWFNNLDSIDTTFDIVTAFHVIEHIVDLDDFLGSVKKLLHDGSTFVVEVPNRSYYSHSSQGSGYWYAIREHLNHFTTAGLNHLFAQHGLHTTACFEYWGMAPNCPYPALLVAAQVDPGDFSRGTSGDILTAIDTVCAQLRSLTIKTDVAVWGLSAIAFQCLAALNDDELSLLSIMDKRHAGGVFRTAAVQDVRGPLHNEENLVIFESASKEAIFLEARRVGWDKRNIHFLR